MSTSDKLSKPNVWVFSNHTFVKPPPIHSTHLQKALEIRTARGQHHLVRLARLSLAGERHVGEALLVPQVPERRHHVALEIVPFEEELLLVRHRRSVVSSAAEKTDDRSHVYGTTGHITPLRRSAQEVAREQDFWGERLFGELNVGTYPGCEGAVGVFRWKHGFQTVTSIMLNNIITQALFRGHKVTDTVRDFSVFAMSRFEKILSNRTIVAWRRG